MVTILFYFTNTSFEVVGVALRQNLYKVISKSWKKDLFDSFLSRSGLGKRFLPFLVFAQDLQLLGQGTDGIDALSVASVVIVHHVYVEHVFPLSSDDRQ